MITYSKIGKKGNLGNQLFQIASTIGIGTTNHQDFSFFKWRYQSYFKNKLPLLSSDLKDFINVEEKEYSYHEWNLENQNYDLAGWLQTEKYFDTDLTKHYFQFSDSLVDHIKSLYTKAFEKCTILISIRRGDFVNHPDYLQLPINYYINSLVQFFPDWETYNLIILSDDINYCKFHFSFLENAFFGDGINEVQQLCLGTLCNNFIISNSTFSWWTAWLGEKKDSKVIRPFKNFDGLKSLALNDKDYYPERWIRYNYRENKITLENLSFFIKTKKNKEEIKIYISNYFDVEYISEENQDQVQNNRAVYVIKKDFFLPPFLIYYSWLQLRKKNSNLIINNTIRIFKLSKPFDYKDFLVQKDFGLFSKVFLFSNDEIIKTKRYNIYLKSNFGSELITEEKNEIRIDFSAGKFCQIGGYSYSLKNFIKKKKTQLKKNIKKIFFK